MVSLTALLDAVQVQRPRGPRWPGCRPGPAAAARPRPDPGRHRCTCPASCSGERRGRRSAGGSWCGCLRKSIVQLLSTRTIEVLYGPLEARTDRLKPLRTRPWLIACPAGLNFSPRRQALCLKFQNFSPSLLRVSPGFLPRAIAWSVQSPRCPYGARGVRGEPRAAVQRRSRASGARRLCCEEDGLRDGAAVGAAGHGAAGGHPLPLVRAAMTAVM